MRSPSPVNGPDSQCGKARTPPGTRNDGADAAESTRTTEAVTSTAPPAAASAGRREGEGADTRTLTWCPTAMPPAGGCSGSLHVCQAVLERALDARVQRVEPLQRERFSRREAPPGGGVGAMVKEHAVQQGREPLVVESARPGVFVDQAHAELDVAEQPAGVRQPDLRAIGEL